jgi:twitching motility protein PilT
MDREKLYRLLRLGLEKGASDIHFQVGYLPLYRFNGDLVELRYKVLTDTDTEAIAKLLLADDPRQGTMNFDEVDLAYELPNEGRFRVNISRQRKYYNVVLRVIPLQIRTFEELNLPNVLRDLAQIRRGCVLVTGATGMGKSTTLATMIEEVNKVRKAKIVTIEDPIEFVFTHDKSIITQREVGTDTRTFPTALHSALRQDPDVIMVGEMRDHQTVTPRSRRRRPVTWCSRRSTPPTSSRRSTGSSRSSRPRSSSRCARASQDNLRAVVSLRLLPNKKGTARVPAVELMVSTRSIQECIKDPAKTHEITDFIARARPEGMQTFDQHLLDLLRANKISVETAMAAASNPTDFKTKLALEGGDPDDRGAVERVLAPMELESDERF